MCSFLGSGPGRGRSPVEWGDFPSVRTYVRPYVRPSPLEPAHRPSDLAGRPSDLAGRPSDLAGSWIGFKPGWGALQTWLGGQSGTGLGSVCQSVYQNN